MTSPYPARHEARIAPMGQGLAVLAIVALFGVGSTVAVGTYLWSLRVASVRARVGVVDERIAAVRRQIAALRMEMMIRSRLVQQERWAPALGLRAADSRQYGADDDQIHALARARRTELAVAVPALLAKSEAPAYDAPGSVAAPTRAASYAPRARREMDDLIGAILR